MLNFVQSKSLENVCAEKKTKPTFKGCLGFPGSCVQEEDGSACLGKVAFNKYIREIINKHIINIS